MTKEKRPGTQSGEDRDLESMARRRQAPPFGVPAVPRGEFDQDEEDSMPVLVDDDDDPTPVETRHGERRRRRMTPQSFAEMTKQDIRDIRKRLDGLQATDANGILEVTQRIAKVEEHLNHLDDVGESVDELRAIRMEIHELKVKLFGLDGTNGRLGTLRKDVDEARRRADAVPTFVKRTLLAAGTGLLGALIPAVIYVRNAAESAASARAESAAERATIRAELDAAKADRAELHAQLNAMLRSARVRASNNNPGDPP